MTSTDPHTHCSTARVNTAPNFFLRQVVETAVTSTRAARVKVCVFERSLIGNSLHVLSLRTKKMRLELLSAANFLVHLVRLAKRGVSEKTLKKFRESLIEVLRRRYRDHWFPGKPFKGSGYRCIRINGKMDPIIGQAGDKCKLPSAFLHATFPSELTMWIDPLEVSYRIGENGSICVLYEYSEGGCEWMPKCQMKRPPPIQDPYTTSKDSHRMDYLLDPKNSVSIEELAALVSDSPKIVRSEDRRQLGGTAQFPQAEPQELAAATSTREVTSSNDWCSCCGSCRPLFSRLKKRLLNSGKLLLAAATMHG